VPRNRRPWGAARPAVPLKDAKLNIEHNVTDKDTGFQGFIVSEGWRRLDVRGPNGEVLAFEGRGSLGELGLTELFFETVEPENANVPIEQMLAKAARGELHDRRPGPGERREHRPDLRDCVADARHPGGPEADLPSGRCTGPGTRGGPAGGPVSKTITGKPVKIIAYQLIIEKDVEPHRHMIGKLGLSMYLPRSTTHIKVPDGFLQRRTAYNWEVLAIERSGNQTLSSGSFRTR
jgi:hypothetical protein